MSLEGRVKWFDARKGYGFIEREGEEDVFVHYSAIQMEGYKALEDGEEVEFEIGPPRAGRGNPQASKVVRRGEAADSVDQVTREAMAEIPEQYRKLIGTRVDGWVNQVDNFGSTIHVSDPVTIWVFVPASNLSRHELEEEQEVSVILKGWDERYYRFIGSDVKLKR